MSSCSQETHAHCSNKEKKASLLQEISTLDSCRWREVFFIYFIFILFFSFLLTINLKFVVSLHEYTGLLKNSNKYSQKSLSQKTTVMK